MGDVLHDLGSDDRARLLFESVFEMVPDAIVLADDDGRYVHANGAACALFGVARDALVGRFVYEFAAPSHDVAGEWSAFHREKVKQGTFNLVPASGGTRIVEYTSVASVFPHRHLSILRDVTERFGETHRVQELLAWVVRSSNDAIVTKDLSGVITSWNRAAETLFGYAAAEAVGQNIRLIIPAERHAEEEEIARRMLEGRVIERLETLRRHKAGHCIDVELSISPIIDHQGQVVGASKVAVDLTGRRRVAAAMALIEEQLRQAQKMEAVGQLASGIAHDFNNLLGVILNYSSLIETALPAGDALRPDVEEIARAGQRGVALTSQLLAFARKQELRPTNLDLAVVLRRSERMLQRLLGAQVELVVAAGAVDVVCADETQVDQVVMNLVINARDALKGGHGKIRIELENVELDAAYAETHLGVVAGHYVLLAVIDDGTGMTPETKEHMFEPFFTTKAKERGTGLGLATVYGIVKQSQGHIAVESELGRGTTVKVYLPRAAGSDFRP